MAHPARVAIADDYEVVVAGVAAVLGEFPDKVTVIETAAGVEPYGDVDVVLYDTFAQTQGPGVDVDTFSRISAAKVVVYSWNIDVELIQRSLDHGVAGYIAKSTTGEELADGLYRAAHGEQVVLTPDRPETVGDWPGQQHGLSKRESEVLALITQGLSNIQIAEQIFVTANTLKSYIRNLYRKIAVQRRAQAVLWGVDHGFEPDRKHTFL